MSLLIRLSTKITNSNFFTMHNLFAFLTMARFICGISLHLNDFVNGFMATNKFA